MWHGWYLEFRGPSVGMQDKTDALTWADCVLFVWCTALGFLSVECTGMDGDSFKFIYKCRLCALRLHCFEVSQCSVFRNGWIFIWLNYWSRLCALPLKCFGVSQCLYGCDCTALGRFSAHMIMSWRCGCDIQYVSECTSSMTHHFVHQRCSNMEVLTLAESAEDSSPISVWLWRHL